MQVSPYTVNETQLYPILYLPDNDTDCAPDYYAIDFDKLCFNCVITDKYPIVCFHKTVDPDYVDSYSIDPVDYVGCSTIMNINKLVQNLSYPDDSYIVVIQDLNILSMAVLIVFLFGLVLAFIFGFKYNEKYYEQYFVFDIITQVVLIGLIILICVSMPIYYYCNSVANYFVNVLDSGAFILGDGVNFNFSQEIAAQYENWGFWGMFCIIFLCLISVVVSIIALFISFSTLEQLN
jgi:hypothetical protein